MVFPIELRAYETAHFTSSPYRYRDVFVAAFLAERPKGSYYAFDVTIHSRTEVSFTAYDMRDFCFGGIGDIIWRGSATVSQELTDEDVEQAIQRAAAVQLIAERAAEDRRIIGGYADQIRAALDATP